MTPSEMKRQLEALALHPGYLALSQAIQEQVDRMQQHILFERCKNADEAMMKEYEKGQLEGRLSIERTRNTLIDSLSVDIERSTKNESSRDSSTGSAGSGNKSP